MTKTATTLKTLAALAASAERKVIERRVFTVPVAQHEEAGELVMTLVREGTWRMNVNLSGPRRVERRQMFDFCIERTK